MSFKPDPTELVQESKPFRSYFEQYCCNSNYVSKEGLILDSRLTLDNHLNSALSWIIKTTVFLLKLPNTLSKIDIDDDI